MCKEEINECLEEGYPCQNSGACVDLIGIYECLCVEGFTGSLCQTNIDECEDVECENNGTCIDMVNGFRCECHGNYTGSYCESEISFVTFGIDINATTSVSNISALETSTTEPFTTDSSIRLATDDATNYTSKPSTQNPSKTTTESTPSENISFAGTLLTTPTTDSSVSSILDTISTTEREIADVLNTSTTTTAVPASTVLSNTTLMKDLSVINASSATSLQTKFKQSDKISSSASTKSSSSDSIYVSTSWTRASSSFSSAPSIPSTNEALKQVKTITVSEQSTMATTTAIPKNFTSHSTSTSKTQSNNTEPQTDLMISSGDVESEELREQYVFLSDISTVKDDISSGDIATDAETTHGFVSSTTESIDVFTESESFSGDTMTSSGEIKVLSDPQKEIESLGDDVTASGDRLPTAQSAIDVDILPETFSGDIMTSSGETKYSTVLETKTSSEESSGEDMTTSGDKSPTTQSAIEVDILPESEIFSGDITSSGETELLPDLESETYSWESSGEDVTASGEMIRTTQIDILNESETFSGDIITPSAETNVLADIESDTYSGESSDEYMTASGDILPTTQRAREVAILPESETFSGDMVISSSETKDLADLERETSSGESSGEDVASIGDMLPITRSTTEIGILTEREPFSRDFITASSESKVLDVLEKEASSGESLGEELSFSGDKMVSRKDSDIISSGDLNVAEQDIEVMSGDGFVRYEDISSGYYQIERVGVTESSGESYDTINEETLSSGDIATTSSALHDGMTSPGYVSDSLYSHYDTSSGATTVDSVYSADVIPFTLTPDLETLESSGEPDSSLLEQEGFISYRETASTSLYLKSSTTTMTASSPVSQTTFSEYISSPDDSVANDTFQSPETISSGDEPLEEAIISSGVDSSEDKDLSSGQIVSEEALFSSGDVVSKEVWVSSGDLPSSDILHSSGDILSEDTFISSGDVMSGDMLSSSRGEITFRPGDIFTEGTTLSATGKIPEDKWLSAGDIMSGDTTLRVLEDISVSSGEFESGGILVPSDVLPKDTSFSSGDMPLVDELASSGDALSGDILHSSGDSLVDGTPSSGDKSPEGAWFYSGDSGDTIPGDIFPEDASSGDSLGKGTPHSGDRSPEGAWFSSGDTIPEDILQSSADSLSEDTNISSGDKMTQDKLLSSGEILSDDRVFSSSGDTLYEDTWLSSGHTLSEDTTISSRDRLQTDETVVSFSGNKPEEPTISSEVGYTEGNVSISEPFLTTDAQLSFAHHTSRGKTREVFPQNRLLGSTTKPSSTTSTTIRTRDTNWVETNGTVTGDSQMKVINYTEFNIASIDDDDIMALKDVLQFETSKTTGQTNQTTERTKTYVTSENTTETPERKLADTMFYQTFTTKFEHTSMVSPSKHNKTQHLLDTSSTSATNNKDVTTTEKSMIDTVDKTTVSTDKSQTEKQTYANNITAGKGLQQGASLSTYTTQKLTLATTANNTQTTHITQVGTTKQMKSDVFRPINPWLLASRHLQKIKLREQISRPNITTATPLHTNTSINETETSTEKMIKETHAMSKHSYFTVQTQKHSTQTTSDAHITTETDLADLEEYTTVDKTVVSDTGFTTDLIVTRGIPSSENMKGASNVNLETETVIDAHLSTEASITTDWSTSEAATDKAKESFENRTMSYINVTSDVNATRAVPSVVPDHTDTSTKMVTISYTDTTSVTSESKHSNLTLINETKIPSQGETSTVMHESVSKVPVLRTLTVDSSNLQQTTDFPQEKSTIIYSPLMKTHKLELTTFSNKSETATQSSESTIGIPGVTTESFSETDSTDMTPEHYTTYKPRNETVTHTTRMIPSPPPMITETPPYFPRANVSDLTDTTSLLFPTLTAAVSTASTEQSATPVIQNLTTLTIPTPTTRMIPSPPPMITEPPHFPLGNMSDLNDTSSFPIPTLTPAVSTASSKQSTTPFIQNLTSLPIPTPTTRMIPSLPPMITEPPPYFPLGNMSDLNDTSSFPIPTLTPAVSTASSKQSTTPFIKNLTSLPIPTPTTRMIPSPPPVITEPPPYFPLGNMSDLNDTSSFPIPTLTPAVSTASSKQSTTPFIQNLTSLPIPTPTTRMIPSPPPMITEPSHFPLGNMSDLNDTSSFPIPTLTPAVSTASSKQSTTPFIQNLTSLPIHTPTTRMIPSPPPMITEPPPYFPLGNMSDLNDTSSFRIPTLTPAVSTASTEQSTTPFIQNLMSLPISTPPQVASSKASTTPIVQPTISSSDIASVSTTVQSTTHSTDKLTQPASLAISSVNTMSLNNVTQTLTSSLTTNVLCKKQLKWSRLKVCVKIANDYRTTFQPEMADLKFNTGSDSNVSSSTIKLSSPPDESTSFTMPGVITPLTSEARKESFEPQKQVTTSLKPTIHVSESPSTSILHDFKTTVAGKDSACAIVEYFGRFKICYKFPVTTATLREISTVSSSFSSKTISTTIYNQIPTSKSTTNTTTSTLSSTTQTPQYTSETPQYTSVSTAIPHIMKTSSQTPSSSTSSTPLKMMSSEKLTFTTPTSATSAFSNQSISAQASSTASTKSESTTLSADSTLASSKPTSTTKLTSTSATIKYSPTYPTSTLDSSPSSSNRTETSEFSSTQVNTSTISSTATSTILTHKPTPNIFTPPSTSKQTSSSTTDSTVLTSRSDSTTKGIFTQTTSPSIQTSTTSPSTHQPSSTFAMPTSKPSTRTSTNYLVTETANVVSVSTSMSSSTMQPITTSFSFSSTSSGAKLSSSPSTETQTSTSESVSKPSPAILSSLIPVTTESNISQVTVSFSKPHSPESSSTKSSLTSTSATTSTEPTYKTTEALHKTETLTSKSSTKRTTAGPIFDTATLSSTPFSTHSVPASSSSVATPKPKPYSRTSLDTKSTATQITEPSSNTPQTITSTIKQEKEHGILIKVLTKHISTTETTLPTSGTTPSEEILYPTPTKKLSVIRHIIDLTSNNTFPKPRKEISEYIRNETVVKKKAILTFKMIKVTVVRTVSDVVDTGRRVVLQSYRRAKDIATKVTVTTYNRAKKLLKQALHRVEALWQYCKTGINHFIVKPLLNARVYVKHRFVKAYSRLGEIFERGKLILNTTVDTVREETSSYFEDLANYYSGVYRQYTSEVKDIFDSLKIPENS